MTKAPIALMEFAPADVTVSKLAGGGMLLKSPQALKPYARCSGEWLEHWAKTAPDRIFLAERAPDGGWRKVSYAQALTAARAIGQALLARGLGPERAAMVLSDNSVDFALLKLGALHVGVPVAPVSPAYSLMSQDHAKLKYIFDLVRPGLVFAADGAPFAKALAALPLDGVEVVTRANPPPGIKTTSFAELLATQPTRAIDDAFAKLGPDTLAKILFTSGSTGVPKGVINTQRMMCSNQQTIVQVWPFIEKKPPVVVDWLPWNHTFGGNHNFNIVLRNGGTMYVDGGKPAPGLIEKSVAMLKEVSPTVYFNVPRGFDMLMPYLESDAQLRDSFFRDLDMVFYAAAALPQTLWDRLWALSEASRGVRVCMVSSWGATETAPMITSVHFPIERAGVIGLPTPGAEVKMVPNGSKLEMRVRGPNVTPGYYKRDDLTKAAFDEEGFYRIGDAGKLADPHDPAKGLVFDGRTAEDFKLLSGTWVHVGTLRVAALAAGSPIIQDAVVTGHDREDVGLLIFPNPAACAGLCGVAPTTPLAELIARPEVRAHVAKGLAAYNADNPGNSTRVVRALLLAEPPSIDAGEITDKGYINQRAVIERRAALIATLYADGPEVIQP